MTPRIFLALHVYTPPSCDVISQIISPPRDCTTRLFKGLILEFCFSHVTWGVGFPLTSHCNEAIPVSFTSMDTRRWHNRRSWDGFTRIALGSLRALIAFRSRRPFISSSSSWSLWSLGPGWSMFAWETRPSSFSSNSLWAMRLAEQSIQGQLNFSIEVLTSDDCTGVRILDSIFRVSLLATLCFCNRKKSLCYKL